MTFGESFATATINMKNGRCNNEKFSARKRAVNYKASRKPPTTNPRIAHAWDLAHQDCRLAKGGTCESYVTTSTRESVVAGADLGY